MKPRFAEGRRRPQPSSGELREPTQSRLPLRSWREVLKDPTRRMVIYAARIFALALQNKRVRSSCGSTFTKDSRSGSQDARSASLGRAPMPTESQSRDTALRLRVRQRIANGQLPVMVSKQLAGGYGSGQGPLLEPLARNVRVDLRGREIAVPEQHLHHTQVRAVIQQVGGEGVPQGLR